MSDPLPRSQYPVWVKLSLLGVPGRGGMWACVGLCLAAALGFGLSAFRESRYWIGAPLFLVGASIYWSAIRWVDRHGDWKNSAG